MADPPGTGPDADAAACGPGQRVPVACAGARSDGDASRQRLLRAGLRLFALQGFARTTTRELAQAASVNIAAISYYFGDKAGLYRAVFLEPLSPLPPDASQPLRPEMDLHEALGAYMAHFTDPLLLGEDGRLCVKLRMREMVEPTGLWHQEVDREIRPMHQALATVLCRHLGLAAPDDALHRLVVCISALGVHLHLGRDVSERIAPQLFQGPEAPCRWAECLITLALGMVEAERQRRAAEPVD